MCLRSYRPPFPPELIDYTIGYLHDSPSTLCTCACVCRAWVAPSRFHLFYRHEITPTVRTSTVPLQIRQLLEFLQGSPHIAFYIREFHFSLGCFMFRMPDSDWPQVDAALPHLLGMLTQLRKLVLIGVPFTGLVPDTRAAFRALFALPCLVHVAVRRLEVAKPEHFTSLLCPPLKRLSASMSLEEHFEFKPEDICAVDEEVRAVELQKRSPCRLEYLHSDSPVFMRWLLGAQTAIDISTIRTLRAGCGLKRMGGLMARLIKRLGSSLEDLTIQCPSLEEWDTIDVQCNTNIRRLTVRAQLNHQLASYLKDLLSRLSAPNIQQIAFAVLLGFHKRIHWQGWNEVDDVLAGVKFGRLREVAIMLHLAHHPGVTRQDIMDQFPSMNAKGILNIWEPDPKTLMDL